jgi:hypothetical protein
LSNIRITIDQLVLEGLDQAQGQASTIKEAMTDELRRLLASRGLPPRMSGPNHMRSLEAGQSDLPATLKPAELGHRIARSLYQGLGGNL